MTNDPILGIPFGGVNTNTVPSEAQRKIAELRQLEEEQIRIQQQRQSLLQQKAATPIWDAIDAEMAPMSAEQRGAMQQDSEYMQVNAELAAEVQSQILVLVRENIERSPKGKELLQRMLDVTKRVKGAILTSERSEMEEWQAFRRASAENPNLTFAEFKAKAKKK